VLIMILDKFPKHAHQYLQMATSVGEIIIYEQFRHKLSIIFSIHSTNIFYDF